MGNLLETHGLQTDETLWAVDGINLKIDSLTFCQLCNKIRNPIRSLVWGGGGWQKDIPNTLVCFCSDKDEQNYTANCVDQQF